MEDGIRARVLDTEQKNAAQYQKLIEMLQQVESRLDDRTTKIVQDMMDEIANLDQKTIKMIEASNERALNLLNQLNESFNSKHSQQAD